MEIITNKTDYDTYIRLDHIDSLSVDDDRLRGTVSGAVIKYTYNDKDML